MNKLLVFVLSTVLSFCILAADKGANQPAKDVFSNLIGSWRVEISGKSKTRDFSVYKVRSVGKEEATLESGFQFSENIPWYYDANAKYANGNLKIEFLDHIKTGNPISMSIEKQDPNSYTGTFGFNDGGSAPMKMTRIEADLTDVNRSFAKEDEDFDVTPTNAPLVSTWNVKTPLTILGGKTIKTLHLKKLIEGNKSVVLIDTSNVRAVRGVALDAKKTDLANATLSLPGAVWMGIRSGETPFFAVDDAKFHDALLKLTKNEKSRPIVFFCWDVAFSLFSYNAALRAIADGYTNVYWYRGGIRSWQEAALPFGKVDAYSW